MTEMDDDALTGGRFSPFSFIEDPHCAGAFYSASSPPPLQAQPLRQVDGNSYAQPAHNFRYPAKEPRFNSQEAMSTVRERMSKAAHDSVDAESDKSHCDGSALGESDKENAKKAAIIKQFTTGKATATAQVKIQGCELPINPSVTKDVMWKCIVAMSRAHEKWYGEYLRIYALVNTKTEQVKKLSAQNKELKKQINALEGVVSQSRNKNSDELNIIYELVKKSIFHKYHFILHEADELGAANLLYDALCAVHGEDPENKDRRAKWLSANKENVTSMVAKARCYVQSRLLDSGKAFYQENNFLPTVDEVKRCALRDIRTDNARDLKIFDWYWTSATVFFTDGKLWARDVPFTTTMLACKNTNLGDDKILFTPTLEALIVILWDNNIEKLQARCEYYTDKKNWQAILPTKAKKVIGADGKKEKAPDPYHDTKYSIDDAGRERFSTWKDEGLALYRQHVQDIRARRTNPSSRRNMLVLEANFLKYLQNKHKKGRGEAKKKKKRKPGELEAARAAKRQSLQSLAADDDDYAVIIEDVPAEEIKFAVEEEEGAGTVV